MEPSARGWPRLQAEGRWSLVHRGHSGLLFPSPGAWLCFFIFLFLQVAVETYGRHVPPQGSAARFRSPDEAVSVFPGLASALTAVGAPLGVHREERRKTGRRTQLRLQNPEKSSELKPRALRTLGGGPHSQSWPQEVKGSHVSDCWLACRFCPQRPVG